MEIVKDLTFDEARQLTDSVAQTLDSIKETVLSLYKGRAWVALQYSTWHAYCDAEFAGYGKMIDREERKELVKDLSKEGLSQRDISSALGIGQTTVRRDIHDNQSEPSGSLLPRTVTDPEGDTTTQSNDPNWVRVETDTEDDEDLDDFDNETPDPEPEPEPEPKLEPVKPQTKPEPVWSADELNLKQELEAGRTIVVTLRGSHANIIRYATEHGLYVRIDRKTAWGNPFELPADGDRVTVIRNYKDHYLPNKPSLLTKIDGLKGKALGCWCAPLSCHGDVLKEAANK